MELISRNLLFVLLALFQATKADIGSYLPWNLPYCSASCLKQLDWSLYPKIQSSDDSTASWNKVLPFVSSICEKAPKVMDCLEKCNEASIWSKVISMGRSGVESVCSNDMGRFKTIGACVIKNWKEIGSGCIKDQCGKYGKELKDGAFSRLPSEFSVEAFSGKADKEFVTACRFLGCLAECGVPPKLCGDETNEMAKSFWMGTSKVAGGFYSAMKSMLGGQGRQIDCQRLASHYKEEPTEGKDEKEEKEEL